MKAPKERIKLPKNTTNENHPPEIFKYSYGPRRQACRAEARAGARVSAAPERLVVDVTMALTRDFNYSSDPLATHTVQTGLLILVVTVSCHSQRDLPSPTSPTSSLSIHV